jgi:hypothetical protein
MTPTGFLLTREQAWTAAYAGMTHHVSFIRLKWYKIKKPAKQPALQNSAS